MWGRFATSRGPRAARGRMSRRTHCGEAHAHGLSPREIPWIYALTGRQGLMACARIGPRRRSHRGGHRGRRRASSERAITELAVDSGPSAVGDCRGRHATGVGGARVTGRKRRPPKASRLTPTEEARQPATNRVPRRRCLTHVGFARRQIVPIQPWAKRVVRLSPAALRNDATLPAV
jgi:hypothetical protein